MTRETLPTRRYSHNFTVEFQGEKYNVTAGFYPDGRIGELFIERVKDRIASKLGYALDGACRDAAVLISLALQYGAELETIGKTVSRDEDGEPAALVGAIIDHIRKDQK